ncbi:MAG: hypothetical protein M3Y33_13450 [Actinomycetota bacterium]|nr:hypothetical protein [Actinomycetota bacterium]
MKEPPESAHRVTAEPSPAATSKTWPWWLTVIVVLGAVLTATGAVLAIFASGDHLNTAGHNYADYFITRNLAVAVMLLVMLALRARRVLAALMILTALTQFLDAVTAITTGRLGLVPIDLIFAAVFTFGAARLTGSQPWLPRRAASRAGQRQREEDGRSPHGYMIG